MRVFVAGATGAIGLPVVRQLIERGHSVVGTTRSADKAAAITALGAEAVIVDALDRNAVRRVVEAVRPDVLTSRAASVRSPRSMQSEQRPGF